ncbi:hypothetical protein [Micromonospora sp. NPDC005652]|uniref:hypothetical protein n=1 Tax=Micromonospora sp. NPDC005652 TaxID=3157046 RepID=UPI0033C508F9
MASNSYPRPDYNGGEVTEALYENLASVQAADGLVGSPADAPLVYADGLGTRTVKVSANRRALVRGFMYDSGSEDIPISLPSNTSGVSRVDLIVLRLSRSTWRVQETYIQGTAGQGAPAPLNNASYFDLPVAEVTVANNAAGLASGTVKPVAWYVGLDGQLLCTPTSRPPVAKGRVIYETDTERWLISNGTTWTPVLDDSGWVTLSAASGWAATTLRLRRVSGVSYLQVDVRRTGGDLAPSAVSRIATIPDGFRLASGLIVFSVGMIMYSGIARVSIEGNGAVNLSNHEPISTGQYLVTSASWPIG